MKKTYFVIFSFLTLVVPGIASSATVTDFKSLVTSVTTSILTPATYLIMALAVVFFLWNIMMVIKNSDNSEELAKFKDKAIWGIVALAVMVTMWGLVNFVTGSLNLNTSEKITIPGLPS